MQTKLQLALATMVSLAAITQSANAQFTQNCTQSQTDQVAGYQAYAGLQLLTASDYIARVRSGSADSTRFDYWFGNHEAAIVEKVETIMQAIYFTLGEAKYHCTCDAPDILPGTVAYVFPTDPEFNVYLCPDFFDQTAPDRLNTWVLGVVSHEMSHFYGTLDEPYEGAPLPNSPAAARALAMDDPATAANDAYNYQFFLSDTERPL
jgi:Lysine-specific metallo-endopeptidase